jgi:hypothetical protein
MVKWFAEASANQTRTHLAQCEDDELMKKEEVRQIGRSVDRSSKEIEG